MWCISFSANVTRGLWLFGCRKYIIHYYYLINFFCLIICSIYLNNSFNKRRAFSFILQEQLYTVLLSILYCALEGDVPKPIILFVALSAFQILTLRNAQTSTRGQYVLSETIRCFRNVKSSSVFRWKVGAAGDGRVTDVRDTSLSHHNSSPLHTYVWKWFWFMCGGVGTVMSRRFTRPCVRGRRLMAISPRPPGYRLSIHLYDNTLRKVFYCLLNTFTAVCHPAGVTSCSHIIRGCDRTRAQIMCSENPHCSALTDWWYQLRYLKLWLH